MELEYRRQATQKTLDKWRGRVFSWGENDAVTLTCAHLAQDHIHNMGGETPQMPEFNSATGAIRALKGMGFDSIADMLDSFLERIPPAMMRVGDIAITPGQDNLESILILAGPLKLMGWHAETGDFVLYDKGMDAVTGAWRVTPGQVG